MGKNPVSAYLSAGAVACLAVGAVLVFVVPAAGKILIGAGLVLWAASFWLNRGAVRSDFAQRLMARKGKALLDDVEREITGRPAGEITRSFCGVNLGASLQGLVGNPEWEEVDPETFELFKARLKPGERLFGHGRINLMAGVIDGKIHRISLFLPRTKGLAELLEKIHGYYGTEYEEKEEWTVWEDKGTKLELLSRENGAHLTLFDMEAGGDDEVL